jgi:hypothetical protein
MLLNSSRCTAVVTGLLLLTGSTIAVAAATACLPPPSVTQAKKPLATDTTFLIVPGQRVGKITKQTDRKALTALFGANNLEDFIDRAPEGQGNTPTTSVKINGTHSLDVVWQDATRQKVISVRTYDPKWHTADGLAVNMSIADLQKKFGKFSFYGFGWDYGGLVITGNPTLDQYRQKSGINFTMAATSRLCQQFTTDCRAVSGDIEISSDNPRLARLQAHIGELSVRL